MAAKCFLDSCKSLQSFCSSKLLDRDDIDTNTLTSFLTDTCIGVTHLNQDFFICENHRKELQTRLYNRRRATICGVPKILNTHNSEPHKKDRCVSVQVALKVKDLYGILIPVGTGKLMGCGVVHTNIGKHCIPENTFH